MSVRILGYPVFSSLPNDCVSEIIESLSEYHSRSWLVCLNPHSYVTAKKDSAFLNALLSAKWIIPDGVGVVIASWLLGCPIAGRVTGYDIFIGLSSELNRHHKSVFFLGSTPDVLRKIERRLRIDFPNLQIAGMFSPPFSDEFDTEIITQICGAINAAGPDVLWVGLTAPKQEKLIKEIFSRVDVNFAAGIGAVFDFYAGEVIRPGPLFQALGLEWLPRLIQQPRRLWRRTAVSAPLFFLDVVREMLSRTRRLL